MMRFISRLFALICLAGTAVHPLSAQSVSTLKTGAAGQPHIDRITACIHVGTQVQNKTCTSLLDRMAELHIPGVSIAVIHNGVVEWAAGFGVKQIGGAPVTTDTLFQAGSISKPIAAMGALHLVQEKKLSLDSDLNTQLTSWKLPDSAISNGKPVTLRELLTHTAGLGVHGFPGYSSTDTIPTLIQVLNGEKPANSAPILPESEPGRKWEYSGGGYTVMQQLLLDVTGETFPKLMEDAVLGPIGMKHSTYLQPLPAASKPAAATPYDRNGRPIAGGAHVYPELAAAGLWTTPSDLARYCIEVQRSLMGASNRVLSEALTKEMVTPGLGNWGLGLQIGGSAADPYFAHGGVNAGFESLFVAYEHHGDGAVIMTNSAGGIALATELMESIATEYHWQGFLP